MIGDNPGNKLFVIWIISRYSAVIKPIGELCGAERDPIVCSNSKSSRTICASGLAIDGGPRCIHDRIRVSKQERNE